jgi:hypothetical protein
MTLSSFLYDKGLDSAIFIEMELIEPSDGVLLNQSTERMQQVSMDERREEGVELRLLREEGRFVERDIM